MGPAVLAATASHDQLGGDRWALGPTGVALRESGPWTYGILANHLFSIFEDRDRPDVNASFFQPFVTHTTASAWSISLNAESTYDWEEDELVLPINLQCSKVLRLGPQRVSVGAGVRYWAATSDTSPEGLGVRVFVTLLFPR